MVGSMNEDERAREISICKRCNGDGFYADHDSPSTHPNGECTTCPIQVPCDCKSEEVGGND